MQYRLLFLLAFFLVGCGRPTGTITSPSIIHKEVSGAPFRDPLIWSSMSGTSWIGTTTPTGIGEAGTMMAIFHGYDPLLVDLTWVSNTTKDSYSGTVSGTLGNIIITATNSGRCSYNAQGSLSEDGNTFSGTYSGSGSDHCVLKAGTFVLRKNVVVCSVDCEPPPPLCVGPWIYNGSNPFELQNSGNATELAYVVANVSPNNLSGPTKYDLDKDKVTSWTSNGNYPVVLVKAGKPYQLYTNVKLGDVLDSPLDDKGKKKDISHVSTFICE